MRARVHSLVAALSLCGFACIEGEGLERASWDADAPLVELEAWSPVAREHDPLVAHRPELVSCPVAAWGSEGDALEIQTGVCNYLALAQPLARGLDPGESIELAMWHDSLDAAEPGLGHFALTLEGEVIGEYEVAIPSPAALVELSWVAPREVPLGAELGLHLHNHGYNSWTLVSVAVGGLD